MEVHAVVAYGTLADSDTASSKTEFPQHAGICKIVPPVSPVLPGGMVLSSVEGKAFKFTTRQQTLAEPNWSNFESINPFSDGTK
jgi:hypothetical protein